MPANEEIIEDAETLFQLVVQFPEDELDGGAPLADEEEGDGAEEGQGQVGPHPSKRKCSDRTLPLISEARKRPRQAHDPEIPVAKLQYESGDSYEINSNVTLSGTGHARAVGLPSSDLPEMELLRCQSLSDDAIDGSHGTLPSEVRSEKNEKKEILSKIAEKLREAGDEFDREVRGRGASSGSSIRVSVALEAVEKLISDLTYDNFQEAVITASGEDPSLQQFVCVFRLLTAVTNKARTANTVRSVNAFYTRYFTSNLADWVNSVGGWRGVWEMLP